jgi:hypothetical protein
MLFLSVLSGEKASYPVHPCHIGTLDGVLDGGDVLPGFRLGVREWREQSWPSQVQLKSVES